MSSSRKAIFFDRDNTLNADPVGYIHDPKEIVLLPYAKEVIQLAKKAGYLLFLHTNQSGIHRGFFTLEQVENCHRRLENLLANGPIFDRICIAPERPDEPAIYRKPSPKFILEMIAEYQLSPENCWMIGDRDSDMQTAYNAGIKGILVETGNDPVTISVGEKNCVGKFKNLQSAWKFIQERDQDDLARN